MRDEVLRQQKDRLLAPLANQIFVTVHPNFVSVIALLIGLLSAVAILNHAYWVGSVSYTHLDVYKRQILYPVSR